MTYEFVLVASVTSPCSLVSAHSSVDLSYLKPEGFSHCLLFGKDLLVTELENSPGKLTCPSTLHPLSLLKPSLTSLTQKL